MTLQGASILWFLSTGATLERLHDSLSAGDLSRPRW